MLPVDVILVGASVRSLAESAIRDGLVPFCVDFFGDTDLRQRLQEIGAAEHLATITSYSDVPGAIVQLDPSVPIILAGGAETDLVLADYLSGKRMVAGMSSATIRRLIDPDIVFATLRNAGCFVPDWTRSNPPATETTGQRRWLIKDSRSSGGLAVKNIADPIAPSPGQYFQRHIDGVCFSATFLQATGQSESPILLGTALQLSGRTALHCNGYQFCGNVGPIEPSASVKERVTEAANALAKNFALRGVFGIDFILHNGEPWVIEINPRLTASHELHDLNLLVDSLNGHPQSQLSLHLSSFTQTQIFNKQIMPTAISPVARLVVYASEDVTICESTVEQLQSFGRTTANKHRSTWVADVPASGSEIKTGTPLCSIYAKISPFKNLSLEKICQHVPSDTSEIAEEFLSEIQDQIALIEKVNNFAN